MTWRDVSIVLWHHNPEAPEVAPGTLGPIIHAILGKKLPVPDFAPYVYEYVRIGDLTSLTIRHLRIRMRLPEEMCPFCAWNSANLMRIRSPKHDVPEGVTTKCLCVVTRPPKDGDDKRKLATLRELGLTMPLEEIAALGLDYGWRPTAAKPKRRRSHEDEIPLTFD